MKALKHGQNICPVCGQVLIPYEKQLQLSINFKEKQR